MNAEAALPCCLCGRELSNAGRGYNQPSGGTAFTSHGHYGSTVFDPMTPGRGGPNIWLELNFCDDCLGRLATEEKVLLVKPKFQRQEYDFVRPWRGREDPDAD